MPRRIAINLQSSIKFSSVMANIVGGDNAQRETVAGRIWSRTKDFIERASEAEATVDEGFGRQQFSELHLRSTCVTSSPGREEEDPPDEATRVLDLETLTVG